jgi:NADH-quinone oxidoreductase subunit N
MLVPFAAAAVAGADLEAAFGATLIYLVIYAVMNLGAFGVVIAGARRTRSGEIADWAGLAKVDPTLGVLTAVFFFSLAGIPPLAGWFAKFEMFRSVMIADPATIALAVIAAINAVIALYYYARVVSSVWLSDPVRELEAGAEASPAPSLRVALGVAVALTLAIGVYPPLATFVQDAAHVLATGG